MTDAIIPQRTARFDEAHHFRGVTKMLEVSTGVCRGKD